MVTRTPLRFAAHTDVGPRRDHNEDAAAAFGSAGPIGVTGRGGKDAFAGAVPADAGVALLVLDGMGGHSSGALACERACEFLARDLVGPWPDLAAERGGWLVALVRRLAAHLTTAAGNTGQAAAGTLAVVVGDVVHVVHVGDVRAYVLRGGRLELRTRDDSLINDARDHGYSEQELRDAPRNVLTQVLGFGEPVPHLQALALADDEVLLLCSDGLHAAVGEAAIAAALTEFAEPAAACAALVELATRAETEDNITALVARRGPAPA